MKKIVVGITGATGAPLAKCLIHFLLNAGHETHVTFSNSGKLVYDLENKPALDLGTDFQLKEPYASATEHPNYHEYKAQNFFAPFASGSSKFDGMAIVPCTMSTAAAIACGITDNLLRRGADVMLKEKRQIVIVPREAPLSVIHLQNLLRLAEIGATIIPPMLSFYQQPTDRVSDQIAFTVSRVLDHLGVDNELVQRWDQRS